MKVNEDKYAKIIAELEDNRSELINMINDLKLLREEALISLLGDGKKDFRDKKKYSKYEMEEYLKIISNFFGTELSIRKQLDMSSEREFNFLRKLSGEEKDSREITAEDIEMLVEKMEEISGKVNPKDSFVTSDLDEL